MADSEGASFPIAACAAALIGVLFAVESAVGLSLASRRWCLVSLTAVGVAGTWKLLVHELVNQHFIDERKEAAAVGNLFSLTKCDSSL